MNIKWSKIKDKIFKEKLVELDNLLTEVSDNLPKTPRSKWTDQLTAWVNSQINKDFLKLNLEEYLVLNKLIETINQELLYNPKAISKYKTKFLETYNKILESKTNSLKIEIAARSIEENKFPIHIIKEWYLKNAHLEPQQFNEAIGKFWNDVGTGALGGAAAGAHTGSFTGTGIGALLGGLAGGGTHLLKKVWNYNKDKSEFDRTKEQAVDVLRKLKQQSEKFDLDANFQTMIDNLIGKLTNTQVHRVNTGQSKVEPQAAAATPVASEPPVAAPEASKIPSVAAQLGNHYDDKDYSAKHRASMKGLGLAPYKVDPEDELAQDEPEKSQEPENGIVSPEEELNRNLKKEIRKLNKQYNAQINAAASTEKEAGGEEESARDVEILRTKAAETQAQIEKLKEQLPQKPSRKKGEEPKVPGKGRQMSPEQAFISNLRMMAGRFNAESITAQQGGNIETAKYLKNKAEKITAYKDQLVDLNKKIIEFTHDAKPVEAEKAHAEFNALVEKIKHEYPNKKKVNASEIAPEGSPTEVPQKLAEPTQSTGVPQNFAKPVDAPVAAQLHPQDAQAHKDAEEHTKKGEYNKLENGNFKNKEEMLENVKGNDFKQALLGKYIETLGALGLDRELFKNARTIKALLQYKIDHPNKQFEGDKNSIDNKNKVIRQIENFNMDNFNNIVKEKFKKDYPIYNASPDNYMKHHSGEIYKNLADAYLKFIEHSKNKPNVAMGTGDIAGSNQPPT